MTFKECLNWARTDLWGIYLVIGGSTRQVRTSGDRDDLGGYRRLAAIEGRVYTRPVKRKSMTFYFVYHSTAISVPDTSKCSYLWLIR